MRRKLGGVLGLTLLALACAGAAAAANGGFSPPNAKSPNAGGINDAYWVILAITSVIFLVVEGALVLFIVRYRSRGRGRLVPGAQVHGHTRIEIIWTLVPVLILAAIVSFVFVKLPRVDNTPDASAAANALRVRIDAHQFYWQFTYPDGQIAIDELVVPVGQVVDVRIHSEDVAHSWWIPSLGGKMDAIPGRVNRTWFKAESEGAYRGQCAEFCGVFHAAMNARVRAVSEAAYRSFLGRAHADLGRSEFEGVCQKCHGIGGKGGYGPALVSNPLLQQPAAVADVVRHGRGRMPPVGAGWTDEQMHALTSYLTEHVFKGAGGGG